MRHHERQREIVTDLCCMSTSSVDGNPQTYMYLSASELWQWSPCDSRGRVRDRI